MCCLLTRQWQLWVSSLGRASLGQSLGYLHGKNNLQSCVSKHLDAVARCLGFGFLGLGFKVPGLGLGVFGFRV